MTGRLDLARAVADAVLYEGYLLYPYRASSEKNRSRWQFGVLGPAGAAAAGVGEADRMRMQTLVTAVRTEAVVTVHVRFLQVQLRQLYDDVGRPVAAAVVDGQEALTWEEAVECERVVVLPLRELVGDGRVETLRVEGGADEAADGSVVRWRWPLEAELVATLSRRGGYAVLDLTLRNTAELGATGDDGTLQERATRHSLIGCHLILVADGLDFVSMTDPPADAADLAAGCHQDRCWPVLTGAVPDTDLLLGSPIILYDYPEIAPESRGALFDSTEIDEILTLRVMTMTDEEKAEARATDARARDIIDRCEAMSAEDLQALHGILRDPHAGVRDVGDLDPVSFDTGELPWWSPEADESVQPGLDAVVIGGVRVARDSLVRVHPKRRADAQDLFFADQVARVTAVLADVDGGTHVALVLADDPAADLHDAAGRYWYFAPDELEPLPVDSTHREESRS